ncbi:MAG: MFS transporter [Sphingobacteriales bacterium]|nr:MAG: MFS transporter [Sphingobacteriales bacterium]
MNNNKLFFWSLTIALGGFLFGMDVAVISGAEQTIQKLWALSDTMHGLAISIALYGTVFGALSGGFFADKLGRKKSLFWVGLLFFVSALGSAIAQDVYTFMIFRFAGGFTIGASSVVAPMYISEIAPAKKRGRLVALFQFNIVFGIMMAYVCNYFLQGINNDWRWMLGIVGIPALLFTALTFLLEESPRWLVLKKNDTAAALRVLHQVDPVNAATTLAAIETSKTKTAKISIAQFFSKKYSWLILLAFLIAFFNQVSGINAIIYYAPRVFELTGLGKSAAFLSSAGVGLINLLFTMLGLALIDKLGRRLLMYIGSVGYIISLGLLAYAFKTQHFDNTVIWVFVFIASHAIGQGTVIWVFISEIFPNEARANGQSLGSTTHWLFAAIVAQVFPLFASGDNPNGPFYIFGFFTVMMVLQLLFVRFMMPETKGVELEDMDVRIGH